MPLPSPGELDRILALEDSGATVQAIAERLTVALEETGQLPPQALDFVAPWGVVSEVRDGGFHQYYFGEHGDLAIEAVDALRRIGAHAGARIVERANAVFGLAGPARDRFARQGQLVTVANAREEALDDLDAELLACASAIEDLLVEHVRLHRESFTAD